MNDASRWCLCGHHDDMHSGSRRSCDEEDWNTGEPCDCISFDPVWSDDEETW